MNINVKELNNKIVEFKKTNNPKRLIMGYKTYSKLLKENNFLDKITKDSDDPINKCYQEIKIKIVTEKHYFDIE